jgi:hypothetical protein
LPTAPTAATSALLLSTPLPRPCSNTYAYEAQPTASGQTPEIFYVRLTSDHSTIVDQLATGTINQDQSATLTASASSTDTGNFINGNTLTCVYVTGPNMYYYCCN